MSKYLPATLGIAAMLLASTSLAQGRVARLPGRWPDYESVRGGRSPNIQGQVEAVHGLRGAAVDQRASLLARCWPTCHRGWWFLAPPQALSGLDLVLTTHNRFSAGRCITYSAPRTSLFGFF